MSKKPRAKRSQMPKNVTIKRHHAKPYRRRHVGLLVVSLAAAIIAIGLIIQYRDQVMTGIASSRSFISSLFTQNSSQDSTISSSNGFALTYNQKDLYASALVGSTDDVYLGSELTTARAYTLLRLAPALDADSRSAALQSSFTLTFHTNTANQSDALEALALQDGGLDAESLNRQANESVTIDGVAFSKTTWQSKPSAQVADVTSQFATYYGLVEGHAVTVVIAQGINGASAELYQPVVDSLKFDEVLSRAAPTSAPVSSGWSKLSLLDTLMQTSIASAATAEVSASEKVAATYSPAVARIYNVYCMDVLIDGQMYWEDSCGASSGSGFFISQDGYVATNGHVAVSTPQDIVIQDALAILSQKGDATVLNGLLAMTTLTTAELSAAGSAQEQLGMMIDAMYEIDSSRFTASNDISNLLVLTTKDKPDVEALLEQTSARQQFSDANSVRAELVAYDYRAVDGYAGYRASDVAILKVDGSNYPITKLGTIDTLSQGANLSILGFPGGASDNSLVDSTATEATLTTGKVSAKKKASGSENMLIETDTTIGHGNSGGPALSDEGLVVGIATYTIDGSGEGNGVYNYVRDVKDLIDLVAAEGITLDTASKTQLEWDKGMESFYTAHYSKALKNFKAVQELYPNHSRVAEFIAAAETRIANGEDVVDFPLIPVIIAASILLIGAGVAVFLIVSHKKKHAIYKAGVAQGTVQPAAAGVPAQQVVVTPGSPTVESPQSAAPSEPAPETPPATPEPASTPPAQPAAPVAPSTPAADPNEPKPFNPFQ